MISFWNFIGLLIVILGGLLLLLFLTHYRKKVPAPLRAIPALERFRQAVGLSVEDGRRLHVSLGSTSMVQPNNASALVGLAALDRLAGVSMLSDRPPVATSGDGTLSILSRDTLHAAYREGNAEEQYQADRGRLTGTSPFTYAVGTMPVIQGEQVSSNLLVGNFGPEAALMMDAADQKGVYTLAASDALSAQSVFYALSEDPLVGEELFAIPAYLQAGAVYRASLTVQDVLRWLVILLLIAGVILKIIGSALGMVIL